MKNETLLFQPSVPESGALKTTIAFPSTYTVGITSLGFQVVWAELAKRKDIDVRRLFTDGGDKPHKQTDLFGISLSWELDGPIFLDLLEQQKIYRLLLKCLVEFIGHNLSNKKILNDKS